MKCLLALFVVGFLPIAANAATYRMTRTYFCSAPIDPVKNFESQNYHTDNKAVNHLNAIGKAIVLEEKANTPAQTQLLDDIAARGAYYSTKPFVLVKDETLKVTPPSECTTCKNGVCTSRPTIIGQGTVTRTVERVCTPGAVSSPCASGCCGPVVGAVRKVASVPAAIVQRQPVRCVVQRVFAIQPLRRLFGRCR